MPRQIINCSPSFSQMAKNIYMMSVDYGIMTYLRHWKTLLFLKMLKLKWDQGFNSLVPQGLTFQEKKLKNLYFKSFFRINWNILEGSYKNGEMKALPGKAFDGFYGFISETPVKLFWKINISFQKLYFYIDMFKLPLIQAQYVVLVSGEA